MDKTPEKENKEKEPTWGSPKGKTPDKKQSPKGKAKVKALAKGKTKGPKGKPAAAQAKVKAKASGSKKRPAAFQEEEAPAKKQKTWKDGLADLEEAEQKEDNEKEDEECEEEHGEEEEKEEDQCFDLCVADGKKDKAKDNKFKALLSQGALPKYLMDAWEKTTKMKVGRTAEQRKIVNSVLDRSSDGRLIVNLDKPQFRELQERFDELSLLFWG